MTATVAEFVEAVKSGDRSKVIGMLEAQPDLVGKDLSESNEHRALHFAVLRRDAAMTELLMTAGADARKGIFPHRDATSAFAMARDREYHEISAVIDKIEQDERLRRENAPNAEVSEAPDDISAAIERGNAELVQELLRDDPSLLRRTRRDGGLLTVAVGHGQLEIVRLLLDLGADVDESIMLEELEVPTRSWGMPLWSAALANEYDIAELLLNRGADPNANVYASGWPLRNAWDHEDGRLKKLLLERGAKRQPYMVAEAHDVAEARRLLESEASEELARELAWSAADHGCPEIVELALGHLSWPLDDPRWHWVLIQPIRGATGDHPDREGHYKSMQTLLQHGIEANVARYGQTALHFAAGYRGDVSDEDRAHLAGLLIDHGASLAFRDDLLRSTPLGWACRWGRQKLAEVLIARGAAVNEADAEPWATPAAWAVKMKRDEMLALLS